MQRQRTKIWCFIFLMMCAGTELLAQPVFTTIPVPSNISETSFDLDIETDVSSLIYTVVLPDNELAPTASEVRDKASFDMGLPNAITSSQDFILGGLPFTIPISGLSASTNYDVYTVAASDIGVLQDFPTLVEVTTESAIPVFQNGTPSLSNVTTSSVDLTANLNRSSTLSFVVLPDGATPPSSIQVMTSQDGDGNAAPIFDIAVTVSDANTDVVETINGLTPATTYDIYVVAFNTVSHIQAAPTLLEVTTESAIPVFQNGTPSLSNVTTNSVDLIANLNRSSTLSYVVLPDGATPPSSIQVMTSQDGDGNAAPIFDISVTVGDANTDVVETINGLTPATTYDIYVVAFNTVSHIQAAPTLLEVTTESAIPVFQNGTPSLSNVTTSSVDLTANLNRSGALSYVVLPDGATPPSSIQVMTSQDGDGNAAPIFDISVTVGDANTDVVETINGLTPVTTYDIYVVAFNTVSHIQATPTLLEVTTESAIPVFQNGTPSVDNVATTSFDLTVNTNRPSNVLYAVFPAGVTPPSTQDLLIPQDGDGNAPIIIASTTTNIGDVLRTVSDLDPSTSYDLYVVAWDIVLGTDYIQTTPTLVEVTTESAIPVFQNGTPSVDNVTTTSFDLTVNTNRPSNILYAVFPAGVTPPSTQDLLIPQDGDGNAPIIIASTTTNIGDVLRTVSDLDPSTSYDLYVVAWDIALGIDYIQAAPILIEITTETPPDDTAPVFINGPDAINIAEEGFDLEVELDEQSVIYAVVLPDGHDEPTSVEVIDRVLNNVGLPNAILGEQFADDGGALNSYNIAGVAHSTSYDVYVVAEDLSLNHQAVPTLVEITTESAIPVFQNGTPSPDNITATSFDLMVNLDRTGYTSYVVLPDGSTAPSAEQVLNFQDADGNAVALSGGFSIDDASTDVISTVNGLSPATSYDVFIVADDDSGDVAVDNAYTQPVLLEVTTEAITPAFQNGTPSVDVDIASLDLTVNLDMIGEAYYVVLPDNAIPPTSSDVLGGFNADGDLAFRAGYIEVNAPSTDETTTISGLTQSTSYDMYVVAWDGEEMGSLQPEPILLEVTMEANQLPVLSSIGNQSIDEGVELTFTATAADADTPAQTLTYSLDATSTGLGMTIDGSTGAFSWTPAEDQDGDHTVTVTVSDGIDEDSETIVVTVNEVNTVPVLSAIGNQTVDVETELTFTATSNDVDVPVQALTYSIDAASEGLGMSINASSGVFSWTPGDTQIDTYSVTLTVSDGVASDTETFDIIVNPVLGLNDLAVSVVIYPNPVQNSFVLDGVGTTMVLLELFDVIGVKHVLSNVEGVYDMSHLASGTYYIHIKNLDGELIAKRKIIKSK